MVVTRDKFGREGEPAEFMRCGLCKIIVPSDDFVRHWGGPSRCLAIRNAKILYDQDFRTIDERYEACLIDAGVPTRAATTEFSEIVGKMCVELWAPAWAVEMIQAMPYKPTWEIQKILIQYQSGTQLDKDAAISKMLLAQEARRDEQL